MANRINASNLSDLLLPMRQRGNAPGVYFVRLCQWSPEIKDFLWRYHEAARAKGVIIEGQIGNPDERQLSYLTEMLGSAFEPNHYPSAAKVDAAHESGKSRFVCRSNVRPDG